MAAYKAHDYATALVQLKAEAENGNRIAQNLVGVIYMNGLDVPTRDTEAMKWFRLAADQGDPVAQTNVGFLYEKGRGVEKNQSEARQWYEKAAAQGDARAAALIRSLNARSGPSPTAAPALHDSGRDAALSVAQPTLGDHEKIAIRNAKQSATTLALAHQYMSSRPGIFQYGNGANVWDPASLDKNGVAMVVADVLRRLKIAPNWNEGNAEWKRMAVTIEQDMATLLRELAADPHSREVATKIDDVFSHGLAAHLSDSQLTELIQYYSSPSGREFSDVQTKMLAEEAAGIKSIQQQAASGQRVQPTQPSPDAKDLKQVLGLFEETLKIQWAALDPGPGHDQSGLQALPMIMTMGTQANYPQIDRAWKTIPEERRMAILAWRDAALAKAEREAIFESAKEIRTVVNVTDEMQRLAGMLARYEQKWRAEISR